MSEAADLSRGTAGARPRRLAAIHQLHFMPWLRYAHKALLADVFVLLDDVQFVKGDWHNRNKLKGANGWYHLTVPVRQRLGQRLCEVEIDRHRDWRRRHLASIRASYARAPCFERVQPRVEAVYMARDWTHLAPFSLALLEQLFELAGIDTPLLLSSQLGVEGRASDRLARLCQAVGADAYLSGRYALEQYLDPELLRDLGVRPWIQQWRAPCYDQVHSRAGFVPELALLDLLMVAGERTRELLLAAGAAVPAA